MTIRLGEMRDDPCSLLAFCFGQELGDLLGDCLAGLRGRGGCPYLGVGFRCPRLIILRDEMLRPRRDPPHADVSVMRAGNDHGPRAPWRVPVRVLGRQVSAQVRIERPFDGHRSSVIGPCSVRIDEKEGARWIPPSKFPRGRTSVRSAGSLLTGSTLTKRQRTTSVLSAARSKDHHESPVRSRGNPPIRRSTWARTRTGRHKQGSESQRILRSDHAWWLDALRGSRSTTHRSSAGSTNQSLRNGVSRLSGPRRSAQSRWTLALGSS